MAVIRDAPETAATKHPRIVGLATAIAVAIAAAAALWIAAAALASAWLVVVAAIASSALLGTAAWFLRKIVIWQATAWVGSYLRQQRYPLRRDRPLDVCFLFADHFEPDFGRAEGDRQVGRVRQWETAYARAVEGHTDSDGRCPQHTWFFPISEHVPEVATIMADWPPRGWGEIEYHVHHDAEMSEDQFGDRILDDIRLLKEIGAVSSGRYGFVHGMFALAGGDPRWCTMHRELDVLIETGCYADFTFGSIGTPAQPRTVNCLYYARTTGDAKPYDTGTICRVGGRADGLLMIPGPMCFGLFPRALDDAHVEPYHLPHPRRIRRWLEAHVHVRGRPNWVFLTVHSHTAREDARGTLFGGGMRELWGALESRFKSAAARLHYLTARETYNIAKAAEAGHDGDPNDYRDFDVPPPNHVEDPTRAR